MTLTLDQLRAYLERREHEASEETNRALNDVLAGGSKRGRARRYDMYLIANARTNLYRELLEVIEAGRLPGD